MGRRFASQSDRIGIGFRQVLGAWCAQNRLTDLRFTPMLFPTDASLWLTSYSWPMPFMASPTGRAWCARCVPHSSPGGHFAIVNWHQRPREETVILGEPRGPKTELRLVPEQTTEAVAKSGLRLANLVEIPPYHYGAVFERPASEP